MAMATITTTLMVLLFVVPAVYAVDYPIVWNSGVPYATWGSDKTLNVGDTITFTYGGSHGVDEVNKNDYDNCVKSNAIKTYTGGNSVVTIDKAGSTYFICPTTDHCDNGMKLAVTVSSTTPTTPTSPSGTPTPNTTSTPPSTTTPTPPTPAGKNGATSSYSMNFMLIGASLLLAPLFALLG